MPSTSLFRTQSALPSIRITEPFTAMRQEMNELMSNLWAGNGLSTRGFFPPLDVAEKDERFELHMDIPGFASKDIDVQVQGNTVTVSGTREEEKEEKGKTFHRIEWSSGTFSRTVTLPCAVNEKEIAAEYTNGVLSVVLPKSEEARPKKISVKR